MRWVGWLRAGLISVLVVGFAERATGLEPWQLGAGPFTTAADVTAHNGLNRDVAAIEAALAKNPPGWAEALTLYAFGQNFPLRDRTHSLGRFADDYHGRLGAVLPAAVGAYGDPTFLNDQAFSALAGTGAFEADPPDLRRAGFAAAARAIVLNWCRFELAEAARKARAAKPNWSLENGAPKNWNEIFAFFWAPDGTPSVYAAMAREANGRAINETLLTALAAGQAKLLAEQWPAEAAAAVAAALDDSSILLVETAAKDMLAALNLGPAWATLRASVAGAAEPMAASDPATTREIIEALRGKPDAAVARRILDRTAKR